MVIVPGRQMPIWARAAWIAALAWSAPLRGLVGHLFSVARIPQMRCG
jgi:hypothetical protein